MGKYCCDLSAECSGGHREYSRAQGMKTNAGPIATLAGIGGAIPSDKFSEAVFRGRLWPVAQQPPCFRNVGPGQRNISRLRIHLLADCSFAGHALERRK